VNVLLNGGAGPPVTTVQMASKLIEKLISMLQRPP
jgi:hypothetical protein